MYIDDEYIIAAREYLLKALIYSKAKNQALSCLRQIDK